MRQIAATLFIFIFSFAVAFSQLRDYRVHQRGMLHQTEFNTGELGRAYSTGSCGPSPGLLGQPSFEWPAHSSVFLDRLYVGQYNSFGAGLWLTANVGWNPTSRICATCGAVSDGSGNPVQVEGVYSWPIYLQKTENYPVLSDGDLNPAYNPDEAEEIITAKWATSTGITVTRTSRAWSFPDYDDFIIYEYELENTGERLNGNAAPPTTVDTLFDLIVCCGYPIAASMFSAERKYIEWLENDFRLADQFGRFDLKRWMTYNHDRNGKPDPIFFDDWASNGKYGGGLNAPQAIGILPLFYDYDHLALRSRSRAYNPPEYVDLVWDANNKLEQPYINRYESGPLPDYYVAYFLDAPNIRKVGPYWNSEDSLTFGTYWIGRGQPDWKLHTHRPVVHMYGFGPYTLAPNDKMKLIIAEVSGFGPGIGSDSIYYDHGGGCGQPGGFNEPPPGIHPVCSWNNKMSYEYLNTTNGTQDPPGSGQYSIGSDYLQTYPLPSYVNSNVISIRDVADRAIQAYTGWPLIKWDSVSAPGQPFQAFDPYYTQVPGTGYTPASGVYNTIPIPVPAPAIQVAFTVNTLYPAGVNKITWGPQIESFSTPRLHAAFSYYEVLRTDHPLSRWTRIDSVGKQDPRYFDVSQYIIYDDSCTYGNTYYYAVVSVDSLGGRSGLTNMTEHQTVIVGVTDKPNGDVPGCFVLENNYPNPFNPTTMIKYQLPVKSKVLLEVFNVLGQRVAVLVDTEQKAGKYQVPFDARVLSSGIYFYRITAGSFIRSQKMLLLR